MTQDKYAYDQQALDNLRLHNPARKISSCDQRCYDLAMNFLKANNLAYPDFGRQLGGEIQELIEAWIETAQEENGQFGVGA